VFIRLEDAERFIKEVRGDDPELAAKLRIKERELEAGGLNLVVCGCLTEVAVWYAAHTAGQPRGGWGC